MEPWNSELFSQKMQDINKREINKALFLFSPQLLLPLLRKRLSSYLLLWHPFSLVVGWSRNRRNWCNRWALAIIRSPQTPDLLVPCDSWKLLHQAPATSSTTESDAYGHYFELLLRHLRRKFWWFSQTFFEIREFLFLVSSFLKGFLLTFSFLFKLVV